MKPLLKQATGALNNLLQDAQLFQALLDVGQDGLPYDLKPHLIGVSFDQQTLILQLDESIWATQLRFYEPNLLGAFQEHFPHLELNRVKVNILPQPKEIRKVRQVTSYPSTEDAQEMNDMGNAISSEGLSNALKNLSLRAQKNP
ncbi:MAG: DciA family protein [Pseudomonadota bacterium]